MIDARASSAEDKNISIPIIGLGIECSPHKGSQGSNKHGSIFLV